MRTLEEFLEILPIVRDQGWGFGGAQWLRNADGRCPICAVIYELTGGEEPFDYRNAASYVNWLFGQVYGELFDYSVVAAVVKAADGGNDCDQELRKYLCSVLI